jgi:hypothetical protein
MSIGGAFAAAAKVQKLAEGYLISQTIHNKARFTP